MTFASPTFGQVSFIRKANCLRKIRTRWARSARGTSLFSLQLHLLFLQNLDID